VAEHLRRCVRRREHLERDRGVARLGQDREAEVGERGLTEAGAEDVGRLDVAVQHTELVGVGERVGDLDPDLAGLGRLERGVAHAVGVRAVAQLHDQIRMLVGRHTGVEEVDHVRVRRHAARRPCLAQEAPLVPLVVERAVFHLDGDLAGDRLLDRAVHRGVPTAGKH
jgi:hypothetical protein